MLGSIGALTAKRRAQHLSTDAEANNLCKNLVFSLLLLLSCALFATGASYLLSQSGAGKARDELVEAYDSKVQAWRDGFRDEFQQGQYSVKVEYFGVSEPRAEGGQLFKLKQDSVQDYISSEETRHDDLLSYTALKYRKDYPLESLSAAEQSEAANLTAHSHYLVVPQEWLKEPLPKRHSPVDRPAASAGTSEVEVENEVVESAAGVSEHSWSVLAQDLAMYPWVETVTNMTVTVTLRNEEGAETAVSLDNVPLSLAQMTSNNYKSCRPRGGIHQTPAAGNHCTIVLSVSRICLVAHKDRHNQWQVDMDHQTKCHRPCVHPCHTIANGTVQYVPQRTANLALAAVRGKTPFEVVVRSSHDPFLEAISLTNGTLTFGPSSSDMKTEGIICVVFGFVLGLPALVHFLVVYSEARRALKYEPYLDTNPPPDPRSRFQDSVSQDYLSFSLQDVTATGRDGAIRTRSSSPMR